MQMRRWLVLGMAGLVCVASMSGCKKKGSKGGVGGVDGVGGVTGSALEGEMLGDRFGAGQEIAGQFAAVLFDYDSSQVKDSERSKIEAVSSYLQSNPSANLTIEGNCDERGSNEYNLSLGERRAMAIRAYLVGLGSDGARIQTRSLGEEKPVAFGHDEGAWSQNRRGEFILVK